LLAEVRGGATVPAAALRHKVALSSAYLWVKRSQNAAADRDVSADRKVVFARAVRAERAKPPGEIRIQVGDAWLRVERGFDAELLRAVVLALGAEKLGEVGA
jgi:hypothetical protein